MLTAKYFIKRSKQSRHTFYSVQTNFESFLYFAVPAVFVLGHILTILFGYNGQWKEYQDPQAPKFKPVQQYVRDAFWPISNGWKHGISDYYFPGSTEPYTEGGYWYKADAKGKFAPRKIWSFDMACILVILCTFIGRGVRLANRNHKVRKHNRAIDKQTKAESETIDMMLDLKEFGTKYNLNTKQVRMLVAKAKKIISHMSADESVYFEMLMRGDLDGIKDQKTFLDLATAIMQGHLETHPEDMELIMEVYDPKSIPQEIMQKYSKKEY